jgi:hypothetical protein
MRLEWPQCVSVGQLRDLLVDPKLIKAEQRKCGVALRGYCEAYSTGIMATARAAAGKAVPFREVHGMRG